MNHTVDTCYTDKDKRWSTPSSWGDPITGKHGDNSTRIIQHSATREEVATTTRRKVRSAEIQIGAAVLYVVGMGEY